MSFHPNNVSSGVVSNTVRLAQDTAQYNIDSLSLDDDKLEKFRDAPDPMHLPSLSSVLHDVYNTTTCLMRLSKPILDSHRYHQNAIRPCDEDDEHHVSHLQRLFPHATLTTLKRLSKSICSRRLELLRMNSHREGLDPALGDDLFLRMVLLEMASISDEAIEHESNTKSSFAAASGRLAAESRTLEDAVIKETSHEERSKPSTGKMENVMFSSEYTLEDLDPSKTDTAQRRHGLVHNTKSHTGPKTRETSVLDHESSYDRSEAFTITACTRCRVVRLTKTRR